MSDPAVVLTSPLPSGLEQIAHGYYPLLQACRQDIGRELADAPAADRLLRYFERGKMVRPLLIFLATAAVGGRASAAIHAAAALEMLHVAALIHDDIVDGADERRGLTTLHKTMGEAVALIVGDYLILRSMDTLAQPTEGADPECVMRALGLLTYHAQECCKGQIRELEPAPDSSEQQYYAIVRQKTASQFVAAVSLGATLGRASFDELKALRSFAINTGIAFQIRDDELDITGDSALLGKPAGNSIAAGRPLLPIIYLEKHGSPAAVIRYDEMQQQCASRDQLVALLEQEGALERTRRVEKRFVENALAALGRLRPTPERDAMVALALYSIERNC